MPSSDLESKGVPRPLRGDADRHEPADDSAAAEKEEDGVVLEDATVDGVRGTAGNPQLLVLPLLRVLILPFCRLTLWREGRLKLLTSADI